MTGWFIPAALLEVGIHCRSMDDPGGQPFGLAPITLADRPLFNAAFRALEQPTTDYSFANTFIWGSSLKLYWTTIDHHLCLFANGTGDLTMLLPPVPMTALRAAESARAGGFGNAPPGMRPLVPHSPLRAEPAQAVATTLHSQEADLRDCLQRCFEVMDEYNDRYAQRERSRIEYVSDELLERIHGAKAMTLSATAMGGDYVYDMSRMIDLAGGQLKSKRHGRSKFLREFPNHRTAPLTEADLPACFALLETWRNRGDESHEGEVTDTHVGSDILRQRDSLACEVALKHHTQLGLTGMTLFVDDKLVGFTLGEALSASQASILIEKTDSNIHGSAQFIFSEFCGKYWSQYPECNAGDDWGIPSLRFTKQSYRPTRLIAKYTLTRQAPVMIGAPAIDIPIQGAACGAQAIAASKVVAAEVGAESGPTPRHNDEATTNANAAHGKVEGPISLRRARMSDVAEILNLESICFTTAEETFNRRQVRYLIMCGRSIVSVAVDAHGKVVGWCVSLVRQHRRWRSGRLYAVAVHPSMQGRGVGRRLVEEALGDLGARGIDRVFLEVRAGNEKAIRLYRRLGFTDQSHLPNYYGRKIHGLRMRATLALPR
jgi:ribosomal protein S18 acetylase RimI-like enzyme